MQTLCLVLDVFCTELRTNRRKILPDTNPHPLQVLPLKTKEQYFQIFV